MSLPLVGYDKMINVLTKTPRWLDQKRNDDVVFEVVAAGQQTIPHQVYARTDWSGNAIRPPVIGVGTPVVSGKLIGRPAILRAARKAKHSASTASPRQPRSSALSTLTPARKAICRINVGL
jgi:hypothetical protein